MPMAPASQVTKKQPSAQAPTFQMSITPPTYSLLTITLTFDRIKTGSKTGYTCVCTRRWAASQMLKVHWVVVETELTFLGECLRTRLFFLFAPGG